MASKWKAYDPATRFPPSEPGCYAIYLDGELVYVGSSANVRKRLMDGHSLDARGYGNSVSTPWGHFSSVIVKVRPARKYGDWAMVELRLIRRLQPRLNRHGNRAWRRVCKAV